MIWGLLGWSGRIFLSQEHQFNVCQVPFAKVMCIGYTKSTVGTLGAWGTLLATQGVGDTQQHQMKTVFQHGCGCSPLPLQFLWLHVFEKI